MASRQTTRLLPVIRTDESGFAARWRAHCERSAGEAPGVEREALKIIERVREGGDAELLALARKQARSKLQRLEVTRDEWDDACELADPADRAALGKAAMRVRDFHRKRIPSSWEMREEGGAFLGHRVRPLARVGVVASPDEVRCLSQIIMSTVPASVVEVPEIFLGVPADRKGRVAPDLLTAARVAGIHRVFKVGGPLAVAAFACGTESIPRVDKIIGRGDAAFSAAKQAVRRYVAVDDPSGPSELCLVADRSATPSWLAADLVAQAEQASGARILLLTHTKALVTRVQEQVAKQLKSRDHAAPVREVLQKGGAICVTRNLAESVELANRYAPERVILAVENPEAAAKEVVNAGAIFLGHYTPAAVGDYLAGPNSMLPTCATARFRSPLGVEDFLKRTSFVKFEPPKLRELGAEVIRLAEVEGLPGQGVSVDLRLQKIRRARREREAAREAEA